jgi:hypothetical protein
MNRESSTQVIRVTTDLGDGYLKAMGNPEGEHALACEWVGTQVARWFGLPTFQFGLIDVTRVDDLHFKRGGKPKRGPAFITRAEEGEPWGGSRRELRRLINLNDITRLVVFDTWTLNEDRYFMRPNGKLRRKFDNVFLSEEAPKGKLLLRVFDHTHCFTNGRDLVPKTLGIDRIQADGIYGCFRAFRPLLNREIGKRCVRELRRMKPDIAEEFVQTIPQEWDVDLRGRRALENFIVQRAAYLAPRIMTMLWPQGDLFESEEPESSS